MMSMFSDFVEEAMEIFMDDFSVYGSSFENCLENFGNITLEVLIQESSFKLGKMSFHGNREGIVLGHKISIAGLEVDQEKLLS